jgi:hypothetical protein
MVKKKTPQKEWVFDCKQTLLQNSFWIFMMLAVYIFCVLGLNIVASIEDEMLKIMGLVFTLFFTLKMLAWNGHPRINLMEKEE